MLNHFRSAFEDADTHHGQKLEHVRQIETRIDKRKKKAKSTYIVSRVRMGVNATIESGRHFFSCTCQQLVFSTWVIVKERGDIVNKAAYQNQGPRLTFFLD
jgi:hypothetical protein